MKCAWQVEIDPFCRKVLMKHWPDVPKYEDVRDVGAQNLEPVDLICGGFPCQDISNAGKRAGIDGERSGLWSEYARIVRELRPRYVLVENVAALLGRGVERVLGDLAESGFHAGWDCLPAAALGAPHLRDRLFILAYAKGGNVAWRGHPRANQRDTERDPSHPTDGREIVADTPGIGCGAWWAWGVAAHGEGIADPARPAPPNAQRNGLEGLQQAGPATRPVVGDGSWWATEPDVGRVAHGVPDRVDRLRGLGNAVVPQVAEFIGRRILKSIG